MSERCVLTIGNFDGVHLGHRAILARARVIADRAGVAVRVITFDPHPAAILRPERAPARLTEGAERVRLLEAGGADEVMLLEPTRPWLGQSAEAFVRSLVEAHRPVAIVEGRDFRFGAGRSGDIGLLRELGRELDYLVEIVEPVEVATNDLLLAPVSSSLIRWLLARGRVADAGRALGRMFELGGAVVAGDRRGRTLGVPTANLDPAALAGRALPGAGVYGGYARVEGRDHPAAISTGLKPTFQGRSLVIEAHLLDYDGDLYGQRIVLRFARWLRDQQPFGDVGALRAQLHRDIAQVREAYEGGLLSLSGPAPTPSRPGNPPDRSAVSMSAGQRSEDHP